MLRSSRIGLTSTRSSARSSPESATISISHVRLAVVEAALHRRADARRDRRIAHVEIERDVHARRPVAGNRERLFDRPSAMPPRSMSFIVKTRTPESRTISFSRSSRLRMPMRTVFSGCTFGREPADARQLRRLLAEQRRERHAVHVAAAAARRRVHVAVRVDPDQRRSARRCGGRSRRWPRPSPAARLWSPPSTSGIAALLEHRERRLVEPLADPRDLADVLLLRVAGRLDLRESARPDRPRRRRVMPRAVSRSPSPAMRNADGPMSTPRRLPPRSSETPMMWTGTHRQDCSIAFQQRAAPHRVNCAPKVDGER